MSDWGDVTILITTFLRDGYLFRCLERLAANLPECRVVVIDDGYPSSDKQALTERIEYRRLDFDSGLSAKRNAGVSACQTKYLLLGCDDFDFGTDEARSGIEKLIAQLDTSALDVASGRVNGYQYEGFLDYPSAHVLRQSWLNTRPLEHIGAALRCDITVNYFLMRVESLRSIPWDERMKIGGEHGDWFLSLKEAGKQVGFVPGVNITTLALGDGPAVQDPSYRSYRDRARDLGHRIFLEKRQLTHMIGFDGEVL